MEIHHKGIIIPHDRLSKIALYGLIEEFVTRGGTDTGDTDGTLEGNVEMVMRHCLNIRDWRFWKRWQCYLGKVFFPRGMGWRDLFRWLTVNDCVDKNISAIQQKKNAGQMRDKIAYMIQKLKKDLQFYP